MPLQDDVFLATGGVISPGTSPEGINTGAITTGLGPVGRVSVYSVIPLTIQAANVAASTSPGATSWTLAAGTGATAKTVNGVSCVQLDCPRALRITNGGNDSGVTFTFTGFDQYGVAMSESITGSNGSTANGQKAWFSVATESHSSAVSTTVSVGTADIFGLPFACTNASYIQGVQWVGNDRDLGTFAAAVSTAPATKTTGDVRGTYAPSASASNGLRALTITQAILGTQVGSSATALSVFGVTQA
jgi:hypothetical protein